MRRITDERLILKNLRNIRVAYVVQTSGIIGILAYDALTKGIDAMRENPLWLVFMLTAVIGAYLSMNIRVEHEGNRTNPKKSLLTSIAVLFIASAGVGFAASLSDGAQLMNSVIIGGILFFCGLIPICYIYYLRMKEQNDHHEE